MRLRAVRVLEHSFIAQRSTLHPERIKNDFLQPLCVQLSGFFLYHIACQAEYDVLITVIITWRTSYGYGVELAYQFWIGDVIFKKIRVRMLDQTGGMA